MASSLELEFRDKGALYICKDVTSFKVINSKDDSMRLMCVGNLQNFPSMELKGTIILLLKIYIGGTLIRSLNFSTDSLDIKRGEEAHLLSCWVRTINLKDYFGNI